MRGRILCRAASVALAGLCLLPFPGDAQAPAAPPKLDSKNALRDATLEVQLLLDEYGGDGAMLREAGFLLDKVLQQDPRYVPAYVQAARVVLKGGHIHSGQYTGGTFEVAEKILLRAAEIDPKHADTFTLLGNLYTVADRLQEAETALTTAQKLGSVNPWTQVNLGDLYMKQKKYEAAQMAYMPVIMNERTDTAQQRKAFIYAAEKQRLMLVWAGQNDLVRELGQKAVAAAAPHEAWPLGNFAGDLVSIGDFDGAIVQARAALARMNYGVGRETLAHALYGKWVQLTKAGKTAEAEKAFAEAYQLLPDLEDAATRFDADAKYTYLTEVRARLLERARQGKPPG